MDGTHRQHERDVWVYTVVFLVCSYMLYIPFSSWISLNGECTKPQFTTSLTYVNPLRRNRLFGTKPTKASICGLLFLGGQHPCYSLSLSLYLSVYLSLTHSLCSFCQIFFLCPFACVCVCVCVMGSLPKVFSVGHSTCKTMRSQPTEVSTSK